MCMKAWRGIREGLGALVPADQAKARAGSGKRNRQARARLQPERDHARPRQPALPAASALDLH